MYTTANIYRKSDDKLIHWGNIFGNTVTALTLASKRVIEAKGINFNECYVICLDNQKHTASKPHHIINGKVCRYNPNKK